MDPRTTNSSPLPSTDEALDPERVVAERWADFTKVLAIYPLANIRVQQTLDDLFAALEHAHAASRKSDAARGYAGVAILFREQRLVYGEEEVELQEGTNLAWLRARLDPTALAGVEFLPGLERDDLVGFAQQLLALYLRKDADPVFETLWPDPIPGLTLIDRRFEGSFGSQSQEEQAYRGGHSTRGAMDGDQLDLIRLLMADSEVADKVAALSQRRDELKGAKRATVPAGELLDRIVQNMPADALKDRQTLVEAMRGVLDALLERVRMEARHDQLSEVHDDMTLSTLLYSVSRMHFARNGPNLTRWTLDEMFPDVVNAKAKLGHAGDDQVHEDTDALLQELQELPLELAMDLSPALAESRAEELAVALHYLVHAEEPRSLPGLYPTLGRLLDDVEPPQLDVLREYLHQYGDGIRSDGSGGAEPPVLAFLKSTNRTNLLRTCGVFDVEWIVRVYPQYFLLYVDSLDLKTQTDRSELDAVCKAIGPERMLSAGADLEQDGGRLSADHVQGILLQPNLDRLPLLRLLLAWHGQRVVGEIAQFLRKLDLPQTEAFLLYTLSSVDVLTPDYLGGLIDLHLGRIQPRRLHLAISDVLCRHVREAPRREAKSSARLESIRNLARYPSGNSWYLLRELSQGFWIPFLAKEPAAVRRLARAICKLQHPV